MDELEFEYLLHIFAVVGENTTTNKRLVFDEMFARYARGEVTIEQRRRLEQAFKYHRKKRWIFAV